jgi:hypothetical protein
MRLGRVYDQVILDWETEIKNSPDRDVVYHARPDSSRKNDGPSFPFRLDWVGSSERIRREHSGDNQIWPIAWFSERGVTSRASDRLVPG